MCLVYEQDMEPLNVILYANYSIRTKPSTDWVWLGSISRRIDC